MVFSRPRNAPRGTCPVQRPLPPRREPLRRVAYLGRCVHWNGGGQTDVVMPPPRRALPFARYLKRGAIALALVSTPAHAGDLPSGQTATLHEVLIDTVNDEPWLRFRFVTPAIARNGGTVSYAEAEPDMAHLCDTLALPYIAEHDLQGEVIVISFADRITEFGVPDPEATQFFEAYRVKNKACVWEGF